LPAADTGLRRVSVHSGTAVIDLALPAGVPVAILIPSIVDILKARDPGNDLEAKRYFLSPLGGPALDPSTTLTQNAIGDGAVLLLSHPTAPPPAPRYDDVAVAVSDTLDAAARPWNESTRRQAARIAGAATASCVVAVGSLALVRNALGTDAARDAGFTAGVLASAGFVALVVMVIARRTYQDAVAGLALGVIGTEFASAAGFVAVPGKPGIAHVLLAAAAGTVTSVSAMRVSGEGGVTLTALSWVGMVAAVAAVVGVIGAAPLYVVCSVSALISLGLLWVAARVSVMLTGLSPTPETGEIGSWVAVKAIRADKCLTNLFAGLSSSATVGAVVTVITGASRLSCIAFGVVTASLLLLRSRFHDKQRMLVFVVSGIVIAGMTFGVAALRAPEHGPWIAVATVILAAVAMYLGFIAPATSLSPVARRGVELLECLALVAMVPLTCSICGLYGAVRGLTLT
jgi:ESX secretion system protein EccD